MSDHTAKRQRLTGSFSPGSPPYHENAKPNNQTKTVFQPNTPTSPPYMSTNPHLHGGPQMGPAFPASEMTPPSSVHMSQHSVSQPAGSAPIAPPFMTPGSTTGFASSNIDSDGDATMEYGIDDDLEATGVHRLSNHNRQGIRSGPGNGEGHRVVAGDQLFKLCQSSHPVSRPHGFQDLFQLYGLKDAAAKVARTDPVTGEKINKLRKSYENQIKNLRIAGKPKANPVPGAFTIPLDWPDEEWQNQRVHGKEIGRALDMKTNKLTPDFDALLNSAFAGMAPGPLPPAESNRYRAYLGLDDITKAKAIESAPNRPALPYTQSSTPVHVSARVPARPERSGSKRTYTDAAWEGYGDGESDDGQGSSMSKRRKFGLEKPSHPVQVGGARR